MEARQLKRDVEALIGDYIGLKLREKSFDPKGKGTSTMLDDLAHYDLAISVALWWLDKEEGQDVLDRDIIGASSSAGSARYPNRLEREAMILSSFAGIIMNSLPVDEILALYRCKPAASYPNHQSKGTLVYPFTLSYHPFAMLSSYKAVHHSKKHTSPLLQWHIVSITLGVCWLVLEGNPKFARLKMFTFTGLKLKRWLSEREKANAPPARVSVQSSSSSSSSHSFLSDSNDCQEEKTEHYEGSQESLQD